MITLLVTRIPRNHVKHFCCQFISIRLIAFNCKKKKTLSSFTFFVAADVGVAVPRQEPNLNNLFRLPTAFDITLKLEGMQYFFLASIAGIVYLFLKRFVDVRRAGAASMIPK